MSAQKDRQDSDKGANKPHKRVGNVAPGSVSGRAAGLSSRRARKAHEDKVDWDPVDGVHYVSAGKVRSATPPEHKPTRAQAPTREERPTRQAPESPRRPQVSSKDVEPPRKEREEREPFGGRVASGASSVAYAVRSLPRNFVDWVSRHLKLVIAIGVVVLVMVALYGPVHRYYVAWRASGDLQAEADQVNGDNEDLKNDLNRLQSQEGIEDEARRRGYTYPDEESATVNGVADDANEGSDTPGQGFSASDLEQPWYIHVLDFIFVYNGPSQS